jgi:predicted transcriptional regulator
MKSIKRSRFEILAEILKLAAGNGVNITRIVYRTNLNFKIARLYINYLIEKEMIEKIEDNGKTKFRTTEKGKNFVEKYNGMLESLP